MKGIFEVIYNVSHWSIADFLRGSGAQTPVIVQYPTIINEQGDAKSLLEGCEYRSSFHMNKSRGFVFWIC